MENPGLKRHSGAEIFSGDIRVYEPQFIKVTYRRTAATTAAYDPERQSWLYDLQEPNYFEEDPAPSHKGFSAQRMIDLKRDHPKYPERFLDDEGNVTSGNEMFAEPYDEDEHTRLTRDLNMGRTAAPPPLVTPHTDGTGYAGVPPEPPTVQENVQTPPPMTGGPSAQPVSATNGLPPLDVRPKTLPMPVQPSAPDANRAANERRKAIQKQVGGGEKENPTYDRAQQQIRNKVQVRRDHPLHQGAYDDQRRQFLYDVDAGPDYYAKDHPPSAYGSTDQPMFQIKEPVDDYGHLRMEEPHEHPAWQGCENCLKENDQGDLYGPDDALHQPYSDAYEHEYKPIEDLPAGVRLAHNNFDSNMADLLGIQGKDGNWDYDPYMHGLYNGMALGAAIHDSPDTEPEYRDAPDTWIEDRVKANGGPPTEAPVGSKEAAASEDDEEARRAELERLEQDPSGALGDLIGNVPLPKKPDERPWTYPSHQQKSTLAGLGFERMGDQWGGDHSQSYWVKQVGNNDHYIAPSREEPRGGYWETSIGPREHWADGAEEPVEPTFHKDFENALQRVQDPEGWHREHMSDFDTEMWNRGKRVPGKMKPYEPSARPDSRIESLSSTWKPAKHWETPGQVEPVLQHPLFRSVESGLKADLSDALRDFTDWSADKRWSLGIPGAVSDLHENIKSLKNPDLYDEDGNVVEPGYQPRQRPRGVEWKNISHKPYHVRQQTVAAAESWDMLHERPEGFNLPNFYRQHGFNVEENSAENLAYLRDPKNLSPSGYPRGNPSGRMMFGIQPDSYVPHDRSDDTADPRQQVDYENFRGDRFNPEDEPCVDCWTKDTSIVPKNEHGQIMGHPWRGLEGSELTRFGSSDESDEEFWGRQPDVVGHMHSPDMAGEEYFDDEDEPDPHAHPDSWSDSDWDDLVPENMSLRDHAKLLRSGVMKWDGDSRYPKYTHTINRAIRDSDGRPAFANEGHVIEHNTRHTGPVLPTEDSPEPDVLQYPWTHTYYPAGQSDDDGLVKGYNTPDAALGATYQLSMMGARHPNSQELLKGYRYLGHTHQPYNPAEELPHEAAQRMSQDR